MQLTIYQGESKSLDYEIALPDGTPKDLSLYFAEWRLTPRGDETPVIAKTLGNGITYTDAAAGQLIVELAPTDTEIPTGIYRRELRITSSGNAHTADYGRLTIADSVFVAG